MTRSNMAPATPWRVVVIGAYGHTGRFVVAELLRRGLVPVLAGRDRHRLEALRDRHPGLEIRPATVDDSAAVDRALAGADAVVNCAGPFAATAAPVIEAALRAGVPYLDVTAEAEVVADTFAAYADQARDAGMAVVPSVGFYGGLGDLLATAAMGDWPAADRIAIAYALSSWRPTAGTRATSKVSAQRRRGGRIVFAGGRMQARVGDAPVVAWTFPAPIGRRDVVAEFTMADSATIPTHLAVRTIGTYMTVEAVADLRSPDPSPPAAVDESGRSAQTFLVEVVATRDGATRRAVASGRDIYAISAPLVVEATCRILEVPGRVAGVVSAGALDAAGNLLGALHPHQLRLDVDQPAGDR